MAKECDTCGLTEDFYGKNTLPLHKIPVGKSSSTTLCNDCAQDAIKNRAISKSQINSSPALRDIHKFYDDQHRKHFGKGVDE